MRSSLALDRVAVARGGRALLTDVSFTVRGGVVALLGPNGVGKTTLLRAIAGLIAPVAGTITLDGTPVQNLAPRVRARSIALVEPAEPVLAALTVGDAVASARFPHHRWWEWEATAEDDAAVGDALARTGLEAFRAREIGTLSAGERQRVWIALALAQHASVVLLDEPTSHLDLKASVETLQLVREIAAGGAPVIAVLHQLEEAAAFADRVIVLGAGGVVADGAPAAALTSETIERAYGVAVTVERRPEGLAFHRNTTRV
ncbi:MAG TPA: ABC transporter ATP-binding protein [Candidatus Elarobacter sp.]|jgi:iron complex transport system ATP-binding protein|nr:ABC transporter ATP-binding protein [Candidatus Elarobacter sp.]